MSIKLSEAVVSSLELTGQEFKEVEWLVEGVLPHPSLGELFARRGAGKTWAALSLALAVAKGEVWLKVGMEAPKARKVLYVDGEMPKDDLAGRVKGLCGGSGPASLKFICLGGEDDPPNFKHATTWARLYELVLKQEIELVVMDNWSSLIKGVDENSNDATRAVMDGPIRLRNAGVSVLMVHHAGKMGTQRGASAREDPLDYVVTLTGQCRPGAPVRFKADLDKSRRRSRWEEPFSVELRPDGAGSKLVWCLAEGKVSAGAQKILDYLEDIGVGEAVRPTLLKRDTKLNGANMKKALAELEAGGRVRFGDHGWFLVG